VSAVATFEGTDANQTVMKSERNLVEGVELALAPEL
jgi:hypothetical protein